MSGYHVSLCPVKAKRGKANRGPARALFAELPVTGVSGEITPNDAAQSIRCGRTTDLLVVGGGCRRGVPTVVRTGLNGQSVSDARKSVCCVRAE